MTFRGSRSMTWRRTFSRPFARSRTCSLSSPAGTWILSRVLPSTWITNVTCSTTSARGSKAGQDCRWTEYSPPIFDQSSSAR